MYTAYWQLNRMPFGSGADAAFYYPSEAHQAALLKLRYALESRRGAALVCGSSGTGKTLLVKLLADRLPDECGPLVHLVYPQLSPEELLSFLAAELGAPGELHERGGVDEVVRRIGRRLLENAQQGRHAVVVIDEAHLLPSPEALDALRLLLNFEHAGQPALTLLFVGQGVLVPTIARLPALEERIAVKCLLRPLALEETLTYVQHRLQAAGARQTIFTQPALEHVHAVAQGVPRRINRLCDLALLLGFAEEHATLGPDHIDAVADELETVAAD